MRSLTSNRIRQDRIRHQFEEQKLLNQSFIPGDKTMNYGKVRFRNNQKENCQRLANPKYQNPKRAKTVDFKWK